MKYKIYLITNIVNGKKYVGQTKAQVWKRWSVHKYCAKRGIDYRFYNAIRKYGAKNFEVVTLEDWATREETNHAEEWWIKILDSTSSDFGYNIKSGGDGKNLPISVKQNISESMLKKHAEDLELRFFMNRGKKNKPLSDEHRLKLSKAKLGKSRTPFSENHKKSLSESIKQSWELRQRELNPRSEGVKNQISDGLKNYHASLTQEEKDLRSQKAREKTLAYYAKKKEVQNV